MAKEKRRTKETRSPKTRDRIGGKKGAKKNRIVEKKTP